VPTKQSHRKSLDNLDVDAALRTIVSATAADTGQAFLDSLVRSLAGTLNTRGAWVTEYLPKTRRLKALAFWLGDEYVYDFEYDIAGTPCERVVCDDQLVHFPANLLESFPGDNMLREVNAVSFLGLPLHSATGEVLGHISVLDSEPMPKEPRSLALFQIFANRAAAELRRLRAESEIREREQKLGRLIDSTMDAIIELDPELKISIVNPAARQAFQTSGDHLTGLSFMEFLSDADRMKLLNLITEIDSRTEGRRSLWIPGGLRITCGNGQTFQAEATLSRYEIRHEVYHTLLLRNVNERIEAEKKIRSLTVQAEYLREEIKELHNFDEMIGQHPAFRKVLNDVSKVAGTDTTVLILGETGTGKELFARAIHAGGTRRDKPLIKVNCAAIPASLIESEFFGHEKGAFTGATSRRDGRFALADGGTIFLDEIAELPLDLQSKLLRVLQEGEFEPVGSAKTRTINVRVIAATNRDLESEVEAGRFRADLYYRLNVFPISIPPLRGRGEDIILLAEHFLDRFARSVGRPRIELTPDCLEHLRSYHWPGNVRELQNIIERAIIASDGDCLDIARALPAAEVPLQASEPSNGTRGNDKVLTSNELQALERRNMLIALETSGWRVAGKSGAAALLQISPSTFNSRMKALGISRPGA
jgi:PAS domain S-box-containing protein